MSTEATHDSATAVQHDKIKPFTLRLYVPESVPNDVMQTAKRILGRNHGGWTEIPARGGYMTDDGDLIEEQTTLIEVNVSQIESRFDSPAQYADHWVQWIKANSEEELVMSDMRNVDVMTA